MRPDPSESTTARFSVGLAVSPCPPHSNSLEIVGEALADPCESPVGGTTIMARPPSVQPTEGELEILKVLWEAGPSGLRQVCAGLRAHRPVATTTVATMLKVMQEKGLVERAGA